MDIEVKGLSTAEALERFVHSLYEDREISIEYIDHIKDKKIDMSLMQMVMEASRIKDEKKIPQGNEDTETAKEKESKNQHLPLVVDLVGSLKEVESYIVADAQGDVLAVSSADYNRDISNSSFYLWVIGNSMGKEFNLGGSANLTCYFKTRKRFIQRYMDYIIMLELSDMTKLSVFKNKLKELFEKLALNMGAGRT
ncbi:MAG: hypothetical protein GY950_05145 [bacterium]|nr:hypothetical protein [bacterium]